MHVNVSYFAKAIHIETVIKEYRKYNVAEYTYNGQTAKRPHLFALGRITMETTLCFEHHFYIEVLEQSGYHFHEQV